ncbi:MAG TPA: N-acetylneuraminate synthase family protein, partial [bacterium]|nr:N-acetylneuraminate synthase family protein [bacterium]
IMLNSGGPLAAQTVYPIRVQYERFRDRCRERGLVFFSTAEDEGSVALLDEVGTELHKVSSMNLTHRPLIEAMARSGRPLLISTGASTLDEVREAVGWARAAGARDLALLHCVANYPLADANANLRAMTVLAAAFPGIPVGWSDHTLAAESAGIAGAAVALGARIIERHYSFDRHRPGYDHEISVDYELLAGWVRAIRRTEAALGSTTKAPAASEEKARRCARRSIVAVRAIRAGETITAAMVAVKRPAGGLAPKELRRVIGAAAQQDIAADALLMAENVALLPEEKGNG